MKKPEEKSNNDHSTQDLSAYRGDGPAACGPGCSCGVGPGNRKARLITFLVIMLAVAGVMAYKALIGTETAVPTEGSAFAVERETTDGSPATAGRASIATPDGTPRGDAVPGGGQPAPEATKDPVQGSSRRGPMLGDTLNSLIELNEVAMNQDAVFVFIPPPKGEPPDGTTNEAVMAAQQSLKRSNISLGLYTLSVGSPNYPIISKQVKTPAVLVAVKGRGMGAVTGEVTESKLLQTFMSASQAGSCSPSGCGASASGCN